MVGAARPLILITGAGGNLGRSLAAALGGDYRIVGLDLAASDDAFPILAADLARRAGARAVDGAVVAFAPDLIDAAVVSGSSTNMPIFAVDGAALGPAAAYVLAPDGDGYRLALVEAESESNGADLTRAIRSIPAGVPLRPVADQSRRLAREDLDSWAALGLALTSADLVGLMRGVLDITVAYAQQRRQYGVAIGSFQAVQHLLAEAHCLMEGALSAALYPAWAADQMEPSEARTAGRVAKAYCARAARAVCETAVQVHGGIGNTWDCIVHVHLRRALLSTQWFGDDGEQLRQLERTRLGVDDGLS